LRGDQPNYTGIRDVGGVELATPISDFLRSGALAIVTAPIPFGPADIGAACRTSGGSGLLRILCYWLYLKPSVNAGLQKRLLTIMATLLSLHPAHIRRLEPQLESDELEERVFFGTVDFVRWVRDDLPILQSDRRLDVTPLDQFDTLTVDFCTGQELIIGAEFHALLPASKGVWELKTPDLRIFGWFPLRDHFIAVVGHLASKVKARALYAKLRDEVVAFRDELDLDPPKYVPGDDPNVVLSNCRYP